MSTPRFGAAMRVGTALGLLLAALITCASLAGATCVALSPAQLFLDPNYSVPRAQANLILVHMPSFGTISLPPRGGALVSLQVLPPQMLDLENEFVAGVHYTGCIDAASGGGQLNFQRAGPYIVRMGYADGHVDHLEVHVVSVPGELPASALAGPPDLTGYKEITSIPTGAKGYRDAAFVTDPTGFGEQSSLDALTSQIRSDQVDAGHPIDVALRYHGASGTIMIGNDRIALDKQGMRNLEKFCLALNRKVKSVTLLSCRTGSGKKGCDLIKKLSECLGSVPVNAMTGRVDTSWRKDGSGNAVPGSVKFVQNGQQTSSASCP